MLSRVLYIFCSFNVTCKLEKDWDNSRDTNATNKQYCGSDTSARAQPRACCVKHVNTGQYG